MPGQDFTVIDAHLHTYPTIEIGQRAVGSFGYRYWGTIPELEAMMEASGISQAVMSSLVPVQEMRKSHLARMPQGLSPEEERRFTAELDASLTARLARRNLWACEAARDNRRLCALICVDVLQSAEQLAGEIKEKIISLGANGLKVHPVVNEHYPWDARLWPAYEAAQEMGFPVLFHAGVSELPNYETEYARVVNFAEVAKAFPEMTMVLAHLGRPDYGATAEIAKAYPNVYFDTAGCFSDPVRTPQELAQEVLALIREIGAERVLFGSDWPWHDPETDIALIKKMDLTRQEKEMILGGNAQRIYHIRTE